MIPRYSFGARYQGQPTIPGIGSVVNVPLEAIYDPTADQAVWSESAIVARYTAACQSIGATNCVLDLESRQDMTVLSRVGNAFLSAGIQPWWYTPCTISDTIWAEVLLESDRTRYQAWLGHLDSLHLPRGLNVAYDLYWRDIDNTNGLYWERVTETARAMVEVYPDARILPIVWHHADTPGRELVRYETFRAMIRFAVRWHGRVSYWYEPPDTDKQWSDARTDPYMAIFADEAGVSLSGVVT